MRAITHLYLDTDNGDHLRAYPLQLPSGARFLNLEVGGLAVVFAGYDREAIAQVRDVAAALTACANETEALLGLAPVDAPLDPVAVHVAADDGMPVLDDEVAF